MLSHSWQQLCHTFANHLILLVYHLPLFPQRTGHQRENPSNLLPPPSPPLSLLSSCYSRGAALSPSKARTSCPRPSPTSGSTSRTDFSHLPLQLLRYFHLKSDFPLTFLQTLSSFAFHSQTSLKKKKSHPSFSFFPQPGPTSVTATRLNPTVLFSPHCFLRCLWWLLPAGLFF